MDGGAAARRREVGGGRFRVAASRADRGVGVRSHGNSMRGGDVERG